VKGVPLALLALVIGATACQEIATSPNNGADPQVRYRLSNPPPPPIDTGASGAFSASTFAVTKSSGLTPHFTVSLAKPGSGVTCETSALAFDIPVTYLVNPTDNSGYLHFNDNGALCVNSSSNGMIKMRDGLVTGHGLVTIQGFDGTLVIDLSSLQSPPSFLGCGNVIGGAPPQNFGGVCFELFFTQATFTPTEGPPINGTVDMNPAPCDSCFLAKPNG
jgi:hypothetical protein